MSVVVESVEKRNSKEKTLVHRADMKASHANRFGRDGLHLGAVVSGFEDDGAFFFSSIRRHTTSLRDWSSDVCSSDLRRRPFVPAHLERQHDHIIVTRLHRA